MRKRLAESEEGKSNVSAELEAKEADLASTRKDLSDAEATIEEAKTESEAQAKRISMLMSDVSGARSAATKAEEDHMKVVESLKAEMSEMKQALVTSTSDLEKMTSDRSVGRGEGGVSRRRGGSTWDPPHISLRKGGGTVGGFGLKGEDR